MLRIIKSYYYLILCVNDVLFEDLGYEDVLYKDVLFEDV